MGKMAHPSALLFHGGHPALQDSSGLAWRLPAASIGKMYHRLLFPPLVATQLPRAAPGRPGGCRPPPWGRCTIGCSSLPWWPPSSPGQLRAGRAAAGLLHGEDVPSAALHSPGGHSAPQGCSGPATARPAAFMLGPLIHSPYKYTFSSSVMLP